MSSPEITIRAYQPGDAGVVADLITTIQRHEFDIPISLEEQPDLSAIETFYGQGASRFWVAIHDDLIIGTSALLDIGDGMAALRKMFVAPAFRGFEQGVAHLLLTHLIDDARKSGIYHIFLGTTADFVAAHRFYEKNGFTHFSKTDLPARFPLMAVDSRFYHKPL